MQECPAVLRQLLVAQPAASLSDWYADPMHYDQARYVQMVVQQALQLAYSRGQTGVGLQLLDIITRYSLSRPVEHLVASLSATLQTPGQLALLNLVYGQLLASRKQPSAMRWLEAGFRLAADLLDAEAYFDLLRRHALLRHLHSGPGTAETHSLESLLTEARVIQQLDRSGTRPRVVGRSADTLG